MPLSTLIEGESRKARSPRRAIIFASSASLIGLALVGMRPPDPKDLTVINVGMVVTLVSLIILIGGIHFYGRLGPQDADERDHAD